MALYSLTSIPVPLNKSQDLGRLASKIDITDTYFAVSKTHYVLINKHQLEACHNVKAHHLTVCPLTFPLMRTSVPSCAMSLYADKDDREVYTQCPIILKSISQWGAQILESEKYLLIFGLQQEHQIWCEHTNQPDPFTSLAYALVSKSLLCRCNVLTNTYFLKGYLCKQIPVSEVSVEHPQNPFTKSIINDIKTDLNTFSLQPENWGDDEKIIPQLLQSINNLTVNNHPDEDLHIADLKRELLHQIERETLTLEREATKITDTSKWFGGSLWFLGLSFVCSIIGTLSCICVCYTFIKHQKTATIVSAGLLGQAKPAFASVDHDTCQYNFIPLLIQAATTLALILASWLILKALNKIHHFFSTNRLPSPNPELYLGYPQVRPTLEIVSGTERLIFPIAVLNGMISEITFIGNLEPRILGYRGSPCGGALTLSFGGTGPCKLLCGTMYINVPDTVAIPWSAMWTIKRMSQRQYRAKIWLIDQYNIAYPLPDSTNIGRFEPGALNMIENISIN